MVEVRYRIAGGDCVTSNKHAFVTAGARGLGKAVVERLLQEGYTVTASYRSSIGWDSAWLEQHRDRLCLVQGDVSEVHSLVRMVKEAVAQQGPIDILVHNAGPYIFERKRLMDYSESEWLSLMNGNLVNVWYLLQEVVPSMRDAQFGRIVFYGYAGVGSAPSWPMRAAFAASKAGLASITRSLAQEEASHGITVNMICPGDIVGEMKERTILEAKQGYGTLISPVGRAGTGEDIARTVLFLVSDASDYITGTIIEVTGAANPLLKVPHIEPLT
ncbi:MAG: SDR family oxidoreductase [Bacilli bacterium]